MFNFLVKDPAISRARRFDMDERISGDNAPKLAFLLA
jgi:hypothetical protein